MRLYITFFSLFFFLTSGFNLRSQYLIKNSSVKNICYAGTKVNRIYVPPPKSFRYISGSKGGGKITAVYSGFTPEPKAAVDYAINILESVLPSDTRITVKISWTKISNANVLGNSLITGFATGWSIDAEMPVAYYPVTVAEKIAGKSLNEEHEADVELTLNSSAKWYLGTDGNTPVSKYDLVTVVIHELCHGLGFFDSMNAQNSVGTYGLAGIPIIYDKFVENLTGENLTDTAHFISGTSNLYLELVSGQLYFNGPLAKKYLSGNRARLYSPSTWDPGSSVSHLDETRTTATDALMTPFIDLGEAIHNPGNLTMSILGDLGWINTRILHRELKDTEENISELGIQVSILSDTLYNKDMVGMVYSFDNFNTFDTLMLSQLVNSNSYYGKINIPSYELKLGYYFFTSDVFSRLYRSPSLAEKKPYTVYIGKDTTNPVINHTPAAYYFEKVDSLVLNATVTDNLGIDTVYIEYQINNGPLKYSGLTKGEPDLYKLKMSLNEETLIGGDTIKYKLFAIDLATARNVTVSPSSGSYKVHIEAIKPTVRSYSTGFSNAADDFFNSGFSIMQPSGFNSPGLHSEHPYKSPDQDYKNLEFSSVLRSPVIFNISGMVISFREVVLVEPGEEGSLFGFSDFYDYVIIEGSKDFGKTWFPLADGYDSRLIPSWEEAYNSSVNLQNSSYIGKESMMLEHVFFPDLRDKISDGDSLLFRFRLFSDPYAHGWGWAIDDLRINPLIDNSEELVTGMTKVFPNPGNGLINIALENENTAVYSYISIYDIFGRCIMREVPFSGARFIINMSGNPPGLYLILINNGSNTKTIKYNLIK